MSWEDCWSNTSKGEEKFSEFVECKKLQMAQYFERRNESILDAVGSSSILCTATP